MAVGRTVIDLGGDDEGSCSWRWLRIAELYLLELHVCGWAYLCLRVTGLMYLAWIKTCTYTNYSAPYVDINFFLTRVNDPLQSPEINGSLAKGQEYCYFITIIHGIVMFER